jgi:endonuclease YncB( thermonuclease family)
MFAPHACMNTARAAFVLAAVLLSIAGTATAQSSKPGASPPEKCSDRYGALPAKIEGLGYQGDADTIHVTGYPRPIRIWGVQAPELRDKDKAETVPGMASRALLDDMFHDARRVTTCVTTKYDLYCRAVAVCSVGKEGDAQEIGLELIKAGMAYGFYLEESVAGMPDINLRYADAEYDARKARRGLWPAWLGEKK